MLCNILSRAGLGAWADPIDRSLRRAANLPTAVIVYRRMINLKLALRTLRRAPFVTSVATVSLALGIGANAAIFSLFNQVLLRALPVPDQDRLVNLSAPEP
jgi:predicted tellurium resistance membrane protein TerC